MKSAYRVLAYLVPLLVAFQVSVIALAFFGLGSWVDNGHDYTKSVQESDSSPVTGGIGAELHGFGAIALLLVGLVLLIVSFFAKIPGGVKWAALVFGDVVLQWVFAIVAFSVWVVGALHGLNALLLFGLGLTTAQRASRYIASASTAASPVSERV